MRTLKKISEVENSLVLRTDFSNETAWQEVCAAIMNPDNVFKTHVDFVSDPQYAGLKADQLQSVLPEQLKIWFAFIVDDVTLSNPEHPILVVDLLDKPGRTFRVVPSEAWQIENNLSILNVDFAEFMDGTDADGVYRRPSGLSREDIGKLGLDF